LAATYLGLVATTALLLRAAWTDYRACKFGNELMLALAGLFILYAFLASQSLDLKWDIGFALLMFVVLLASYALNWMGGWDVKLLTVAFLWTGLSAALAFAVLLAVFSALHALAARLGWANSQQTTSGGRRIPFAPSIAGALICTFMLRSLQSV
jgi:Flp pilus assembly protein protease CpaA